MMSYPSLPGAFDTEAFSFMSDVAALDEFQKVVQEIDNSELRQKVQQAMANVITPWTQRQDDLISTLNQVEKSYAALQQETHARSALYHKSVRDLQFYKANYHSIRSNNFTGVNTSVNKISTTCTSMPPEDSSIDYRSHPTIDNSSSNISITSSSDYSQVTKSSTHISDDHSSLSFSNSFLTTNDSMNDQFDLLSIIDQSHPIYIPPQKPPPSNDLPLPPLPMSTSSSHPSTTKNTTHQKYHFQSPTPPSPFSTEELKFACGDGFWNTIAKGKSNKNEVDLLIKNYLKRGGQANVANNSGTIQSIKEGYGLIHALIVIKNTSALQRVIEAGANPHALPLPGTSGNNSRSKENNNFAPLVLAARLGYLNGVRLLVERAHVNVLASKGPRQENALLAAIEANAFDVVTYLLKVSNQLLDQADIFGATPLHYACMTGKTKMISFLVRECGQLPEATDYKGETPLHYAIRHRRAKAVAFLVGELDAYPNAYVVKKVPTPLDLAKAKGLRNVTEFLRKMGAKSTKEMEKKSSSVFTSPVPRMASPGSAAVAASESSHTGLVRSDYSIHSIHSGRTSTSNESIII